MRNIDHNMIIVIGDIILDHYIDGSSSRLSPEAPIPVVNFLNENFTLGGAANVAKIIKNFNESVLLIGLIGSDEDGLILKKKINELKIKSYLIKKKDFKTIKKTRIISDDFQIVRVDYENTNYIFKEIQLIIDFIKKIDSKKIDSVIISDYDKGFLANPKKLISYLNSKKIKTFIDTKKANIECYKNTYFIKPNLKEFNKILNFLNLKFHKKFTKKEIIKFYNIKYLLLTKGSEGLELINNHKTIQYKADKIDVIDVTGAGDMVLASLVTFLNKNYSLNEAVKLSNLAASKIVKVKGTGNLQYEDLFSVPKSKFLKLTHLIKVVKDLKKLNKKIIFTNGCFDVLHRGHIHLFEQAKKFGDILIVAVNSDQSIKNLKGSSRPINILEDRVQMLKSIIFIDYIISFEQDTPLELIKSINPDVLVKGSDYKIKDIVGYNFMKKNNKNIKIIKKFKNLSTTRLLKKNK